MIYFDSERLIFRDWKDEDLSEFRKMNADPNVMEYFPSTLTHAETDAFFERIIDDMQSVGYGLYAVEVKETGAFIGFIGFHQANLNLGFDPFVEIGWRLIKKAWGKGYAQEGAKRCLAYGFEQLKLTDVYSFTSVQNTRSERVMRNIGMTKQMVFDHPRIDKVHVLCKHVLYRIKNDCVAVSYKRLQAGDASLFAELVKLFNVEFEKPDLDYVNVENIKSLLTKPDFVCFVALSENQVVGGLTGYALKMYAQAGSTMYLYDMAVANAYQRKGIGSKLVSELKMYCAHNGIRDMYVQADVSDDHAIAFYKTLGGEPADVVHFTFDISK